MTRKQEVAIIGYGRFGRLAAHYLKKEFVVFVADVRRLSDVEAGTRKISVAEAATKKNIILSVPINKLPALLNAIAPLVKPGTLVCDVCSVKEQPVRWMKDLLPKHVSILGTHPLFGPDSAGTNVTGKVVFLCPVRISQTKLRNIRSRLTKLGLVTHRISPERHDRLMSPTLFLTQLVGHALSRMDLPKTPFTTENFRSLRHIALTTSNDTRELFRDMYKYNRFTAAIPRQVVKHFGKLSKILTSRNF